MKTTLNQKISIRKSNNVLLLCMMSSSKLSQYPFPSNGCLWGWGWGTHCGVCVYHDLMFSLSQGSSILVCPQPNREHRGHMMGNSRVNHQHSCDQPWAGLSLCPWPVPSPLTLSLLSTSRSWPSHSTAPALSSAISFLNFSLSARGASLKQLFQEWSPSIPLQVPFVPPWLPDET